MTKPRAFTNLIVICTFIVLAACSTRPEVTPQTSATPPPTAVPPRPYGRAAAIEQPTVIPGSVRDFEVNVGDRVFFQYDKFDLDDGAQTTLQKQAAWLKRYPAVVLTVEGHCDERGTREYNLALGARRADSVKEYLTSLGVSGARLTTISYGKERPVCTVSNEACWSQNRRGVSVIKNGATAVVSSAR